MNPPAQPRTIILVLYRQRTTNTKSRESVHQRGAHDESVHCSEARYAEIQNTECSDEDYARIPARLDEARVKAEHTVYTDHSYQTSRTFEPTDNSWKHKDR